jgi:hypothetical protein
MLVLSVPEYDLGSAFQCSLVGVITIRIKNNLAPGKPGINYHATGITGS